MDASIAIEVASCCLKLTSLTGVDELALTCSTLSNVTCKCQCSNPLSRVINAPIWSWHATLTGNHPSPTIYAAILEYELNANLAIAVDPLNAANDGHDGLTRRGLRR